MRDDQADLLLIQMVSDGDPTALAELYERHAPLLFALILRIVRDRGEAEDVLQEVLLRVWQRADTYDSLFGAPRAWLIRIARNRAIDMVRARNRRPSTPAEIPDQPSLSCGPDQASIVEEERQAVSGALSDLPLEQRVLIEDAFFRGYSQSELALKFQLPLGTVKTRIRRGMMLLRGRLRHIYES